MPAYPTHQNNVYSLKPVAERSIDQTAADLDNKLVELGDSPLVFQSHAILVAYQKKHRLLICKPDGSSIANMGYEEKLRTAIAILHHELLSITQECLLIENISYGRIYQNRIAGRLDIDTNNDFYDMDLLLAICKKVLSLEAPQSFKQGVLDQMHALDGEDAMQKHWKIIRASLASEAYFETSPDNAMGPIEPKPHIPYSLPVILQMYSDVAAQRSAERHRQFEKCTMLLHALEIKYPTNCFSSQLPTRMDIQKSLSSSPNRLSAAIEEIIAREPNTDDDPILYEVPVSETTREAIGSSHRFVTWRIRCVKTRDITFSHYALNGVTANAEEHAYCRHEAFVVVLNTALS